MNTKSYYDVAMEDYKFLVFSYEHLDEVPGYNAIVVQEQQVVEKLLKHVLDTVVDLDNSIDLLKSHKLANIRRAISKCMDCPLKDADMRFLTDFYFDGRYPSSDYVIAEKQDAIEGFRIVEETLNWVVFVIGETKQVNAF